jgi:5-(carboxyamino)imidazole ribonucleotide synthase
MILPPATLGLLGGGQLGRYFVIAAHDLGYRVVVLDPDPESPAGRIADTHLASAYDDPAALRYLAESCAAVTTEFENVPAAALQYLSMSVPVRPDANSVAICQNRSGEKGFLKRHGFPHAPYADILDDTDAQDADTGLFPGILKVARFGYDGKGQIHVNSRAEALAAFRHFSSEPCVLEKKLSLEHEISVVLARNEAGETKSFPAAANRHLHGVLDTSSVPPANACLIENAEMMAVEIACRMNYVGVLAVEYFVVSGQLYVNEMAPRPHNSGHYTLDACLTDQFEQQVRVLCGLPLGDTRLHSAATMVNLLGDLWFPDNSGVAREPDWQKLLAVPKLKLHLYGKRHAKPGRKMGHFTVVGEHSGDVERLALAARRAIGIENPGNDDKSPVAAGD